MPLSGSVKPCQDIIEDHDLIARIERSRERLHKLLAEIKPIDKHEVLPLSFAVLHSAENHGSQSLFDPHPLVP